MAIRKTPRNSIDSLLMGIVALTLTAIPYFGSILGLAVALAGVRCANTGLKRYNHNPRIYSSNKMLCIAKILSLTAIIVDIILVTGLILSVIVTKSEIK